MIEGKYHFIGIGGVGMSAIAEIFQKAGAEVSGSDKKESATLEKLRGLGIDCWVGSKPENISGPCTVVYSSAIRVTDPEFAYACKSEWPLLHRSQALALAAADRDMVAVSGTHGKTTTSSMMAVGLDKIGAKPSFAIGANIPYFNTGARWNEGPLFVAETDESDGSFFHYHPKVAIIANIDADHLDNYGNLEVFEAAFYRFCTTIKEGGAVVLNTDDEGGKRLLERIKMAKSGKLVWPELDFSKRIAGGQQSFVEKFLKEEPPTLAEDLTIIGFGQGERPEGVDCYWQIGDNHSSTQDGEVLNSALIKSDGGKEYSLKLAIPGFHNIYNAVSVMAAAAFLRQNMDDFTQALGEYQGSRRRLELKGTVGGIRVYDDFAHHPTEVKALLQQVREIVGNGKIRLLFQPHLVSRTVLFAKEFAEVLVGADHCVVCDIDPAREDPNPDITSQIICDYAPEIEFIPSREEAAKYLAQSAQENDILLTSGCGNITEISADIVKYLELRKE